jgi:ferredoxin
MVKKLFILIFLLLMPASSAHVQQTQIDDYNILLSHAPMELQPQVPTVFLINIERDGKPVEGLEVTFQISHMGHDPAILKATSGEVYKVPYTASEEGDYMAMISFSHRGQEIMAHFMVSVASHTDQMLMGGSESGESLLRRILPLLAVVLLSFLFAYKILGKLPVKDYRIDVFRFNPLKKAFKSRPILNILQTTSLGMYLLLIIAGLIGTQMAASNIATVTVWTLWWTGVILLILLFGKFWCTLCPWHTTTTWMKKLNLSFNRNWPARLNNIYPAIALLAAVTWLEVGFSITHSPKYTSYLLVSLLGVSMVSAAVFKRRAFCMHVCFIGAIQGVYSSITPLELRSKDKETCKTCSTKDCMRGNENGDPCPVMIYPGAMARNNQCILCNECIKTCPHDNIAMNIRPLASELVKVKNHKFTEATFIVALLGLTFYPSATMFSAWMRFVMTVPKETFYLLITALTIASIILPVIITYSFSWASKALSGIKKLTVKDVFRTYAFSLIPLALFYHLAHNIMHIMMEGNRVSRVISDPLGRGWNLFGTRDEIIMTASHHTPLKDTQSSLILIGLFISTVVAFKLSLKLYGDEKRAIRGFTPISVLLLLIAFLAVIFLSQPMNMTTM